MKRSHINKLKQYINKSGFSEFVSIHAGKESVFVFLKDYYKLNDDEIIVVGDAANDLGLFKNAVNRVAVSNATEELLEISTYIVNNEDYLGISRLLKKII